MFPAFASIALPGSDCVAWSRGHHYHMDGQRHRCRCGAQLPGGGRLHQHLVLPCRHLRAACVRKNHWLQLESFIGSALRALGYRRAAARTSTSPAEPSRTAGTRSSACSRAGPGPARRPATGTPPPTTRFLGPPQRSRPPAAADSWSMSSSRPGCRLTVRSWLQRRSATRHSFEAAAWSCQPQARTGHSSFGEAAGQLRLR